jgi:hypothetical protein
VNVSCTNCGKRYVLSDDKVAGKTSVKIRCKQCQSLISIDVATGAGSLASGPPQATPQASTGNPHTGNPHASMSRSSGAMAMSSVQPVTSATGGSPWEDEATKSMPAMDLSVQWHAMIAGVQQGPFDIKTLMTKVAAGEVTLRTYLWRAGMGDWKRAADVPEVSPVFAGSPQPPSASSDSPAPQAGKPLSKPAQPAVARKDVAVANEMPSPEVTKPKGGNVADPLPSSHLSADVMPNGQQPGGQQANGQQANGQQANGQRANGPSDVAAKVTLASGNFAEASLATTGQRSSSGEPQPLNDLFGDISNGDVPPPSEADKAPVDPFAALGEPSQSELPPPGEATKFFIAQAGVNKRNPPWKIALFGLSIFGLPAAVIYLLSTFNVVQLPKVTRTTDDGQEVQESFFSPGGVTGLKDMLTGDAKKRRDEAERKKRELAQAQAAAKDRAAKNQGEILPSDSSGSPKVAGPDLKSFFEEDNGRSNRGPRDREKVAAAALASAGLKPEVANKVVTDNLKAFNLCIDNALRRNPNLKVGSVTVVLSVGASGAVKSAGITPKQHEGSDWAGCIMQAGKRIVFPPSDGETDVEVPLKVGAAL